VGSRKPGCVVTLLAIELTAILTHEVGDEELW
jgi:hypothetical protein